MTLPNLNSEALKNWIDSSTDLGFKVCELSNEDTIQFKKALEKVYKDNDKFFKSYDEHCDKLLREIQAKHGCQTTRQDSIHLFMINNEMKGYLLGRVA